MRKNREKKENNGAWKEFFYNCPYLTAVIVTSLVMLVCSKEIGVRAIVGEAKETVRQTMGIDLFARELSADPGTDYAYAEDDLENIVNNGKNAEQDAGICKENTNDKEDDIKQKYDNNDDKNLENTGISETYTAKFEYYEPQAIDSIYYSDAGKVALTTEYPYTKESISYFNDAAFLGDSRTLGISDYAGLDEADFYCDSGMMIFKLLEEAVTYRRTGDKVELSQALQEKRYGKIYIMLGMNELGYGNTEMYLEQYRQVVEKIREWQPDAIIYIMANLHVSREKNNMETEFNNVNINDKNAAAAQLANGTDIFYLDANPLFTDADGFLNAELSFDGVHLYAQHYDAWREFLLEHAVEPAVERKDEVEDAAETDLPTSGI